MLTPIASTGSSRVEPQRAASSSTNRADEQVSGLTNGHDTPAARLAKLGPPIDVTRVGEIRAAIANGSYTVDADRLAAAMLALDVPEANA